MLRVRSEQLQALAGVKRRRLEDQLLCALAAGPRSARPDLAEVRLRRRIRAAIQAALDLGWGDAHDVARYAQAVVPLGDPSPAWAQAIVKDPSLSRARQLERLAARGAAERELLATDPRGDPGGQRGR